MKTVALAAVVGLMVGCGGSDGEEAHPIEVAALEWCDDGPQGEGSWMDRLYAYRDCDAIPGSLDARNVALNFCAACEVWWTYGEDFGTPPANCADILEYRFTGCDCDFSDTGPDLESAGCEQGNPEPCDIVPQGGCHLPY